VLPRSAPRFLWSVVSKPPKTESLPERSGGASRILSEADPQHGIPGGIFRAPQQFAIGPVGHAVFVLPSPTTRPAFFATKSTTTTTSVAATKAPAGVADAGAFSQPPGRAAFPDGFGPPRGVGLGPQRSGRHDNGGLVSLGPPVARPEAPETRGPIGRCFFRKQPCGLVVTNNPTAMMRCDAASWSAVGWMHAPCHLCRRHGWNHSISQADGTQNNTRALCNEPQRYFFYGWTSGSYHRLECRCSGENWGEKHGECSQRRHCIPRAYRCRLANQNTSSRTDPAMEKVTNENYLGIILPQRRYHIGLYCCEIFCCVVK